MRILLFTHSMAGGGAERTVATLANYWADHGWDVTVATLAPQEDDFYALRPGVRRIALDLSGDSKSPLAAVRQNLRRIRALRRVLTQLRPKVALAMMSTPNVLLALAGQGMPWLMRVGSERCYPPHAPLRWPWSIARTRMYGRLDAVVALTNECGRWIAMHTLARIIPVIPNAVVCPLPCVAPWIVPNEVVAPERRILLAVGRLDPVKNFAGLLAVFARLVDRYRNWDLVILGEGPERAALQVTRAVLGLEGRVVMPGIAGNVAQWHERCDLFVLSSHSEGFPNALAEALCHGMPAVSVDCDTGPRDILRHGIDGLLVAPDNLDALEGALDALMGNSVLRQQFAVRATDARERFSIGRIAAMWETLFHGIESAGKTSRRPDGVADSRGFLP